jgi:plastocyanin
VALAALAIGAAGCGSSSTKSASTKEAGQAAAPGTVSMRNLAFEPRKSIVKVGQKVTWTNNDTVDHNVTATRGAKFMSQAFGNGSTYSYTPRRPGTIAYVCTLHPGMTGTLVVQR